MISWGIFRLRGLFNRKTVKARVLHDGDYAMTERTTTDRIKISSARPSSTSPDESTTYMTQIIVPKQEFEKCYLPVDTIAKGMV